MSPFSSTALQSLTTTALQAAVGGPEFAALQAASTLMNSAGSALISQLGQQTGQSSSAIHRAQAEFASSAQTPVLSLSDAAHQYAQASGMSPYEEGQLDSALQQGVSSAASNWAQIANQDLLQAGQRQNGKGQCSGGGGIGGIGSAGTGSMASSAASGADGGILVAIAQGLGKVLDKNMDEMASMTKQLGQVQSGSSQYGQLTGEIQAKGQLISMISDALKNSISSLGQAAGELARKG